MSNIHNEKQFHHMEGDGLTPGPGYRDIADMTDGADKSHGGNAPDVMYGYGGHDRLVGNKAGDELYGMNGADKLRGGVGKDILDGGAGRDHLHGGRNGDTLTGGGGEDTFHFRNAMNSHKGDADVITDFQTGVDHIKFASAGDLAGVTAADIHIADDGHGGSIVTIEGTHFELLSTKPIAITDFDL